MSLGKKKHYSRLKTASMTLNTATAAANTLLSWNVQQGQHTLPTRPTTPKLHRSLPTWSTNPVLNCLFNKRLCKFSPSALSNLWIQEPRIECANYDIPALGDWGTCTVWLFIRITQWAPDTLILPSRSRQAWRSCTQYSASSFRIMHHVLFFKNGSRKHRIWICFQVLCAHINHVMLQACTGLFVAGLVYRILGEVSGRRHPQC